MNFPLEKGKFIEWRGKFIILLVYYIQLHASHRTNAQTLVIGEWGGGGEKK